MASKRKDGIESNEMLTVISGVNIKAPALALAAEQDKQAKMLIELRKTKAQKMLDCGIAVAKIGEMEPATKMLLKWYQTERARQDALPGTVAKECSQVTTIIRACLSGKAAINKLQENAHLQVTAFCQLAKEVTSKEHKSKRKGGRTAKSSVTDKEMGRVGKLLNLMSLIQVQSLIALAQKREHALLTAPANAVQPAATADNKVTNLAEARKAKTRKLSIKKVKVAKAKAKRKVA